MNETLVIALLGLGAVYMFTQHSSSQPQAQAPQQAPAPSSSGGGSGFDWGSAGNTAVSLLDNFLGGNNDSSDPWLD